MTAPWPGEKIGFYDAFVLAGGKDPYDDVFYPLDIREDPDTTATFVAGDDFYVYADYSRTILDDTDAIGEVNWIIDVTGGAGDVEVYVSKDPGYSYTEPTWPAADTRTWAPGRQVYPVPVPDRTYDWLYGNDGALAIRVRVVSGTVTLSKVWLQAEPPTGLLAITGFTLSDQITPPIIYQTAPKRYSSLFWNASKAWVLTGDPTTYDNTPDLQEEFDAVAYNSSASTVDAPTTSDFEASIGWSMGSQAEGGLVPPAHNMSTYCGYSRLEMVAQWTSYPTTKPAPTIVGIRNRDYYYESGAAHVWAAGDTETIGWDTENVYVVLSEQYSENDTTFGTGAQDQTGSLTGNIAGPVSTLSGPYPLPGMDTTHNAYSVVSALPNTDLTFTPAFSWPEVGPPVFGSGWGDGIGRSQKAGGNASWWWCGKNSSDQFYRTSPRLKLQRPNYQVKVPTFALSPDSIGGPGGGTGDWSPELTNFDLVDGIFNSVADAGEYIYTGEVDTSIPTPNLWFVYRPYAFGGDHVLVYGTGLGAPQSEYHGRMWLDWGPNYDTSDWEPTVVGWTASPAGTHAYTGEGQIFPGTDAAPPVVDLEVEVVEIIVPPEIVGDGAFTDWVYAVTDGGVSNRLPLMVYPIAPVGMASTAPSNRVRTAVRVGSAMPTGEVIPELFAAYQPSSYIIASNRPERLPEFMALGYSDMVLTGGTETTGAEDPVDVALEMQLRWRPLDSAIVPRTDLGTGVSAWTPTTSSTQGWRFVNTSAPYVDADHTYPSRFGELVRPAMIFPGDGYMELLNAVPAGPAFTLLFVAQLYATDNAKSVILASNPTGTPDPTAYPLELALIGDVLQLTIGTSIAQARLASGYVGQRPVIIAVRTNGTQGGLSVISSSVFNKDFVHPRLDTTGLKLFLGRANDPSELMIPRMDILDMGFSDYQFSYTTLWRQMNFLDGAYGVSQ